MLEVRLLGTFEVKYGNQSVSISSRPAQSLFAYLVLNAGKSPRREKLAGLFWPDSTEEMARDNLRHALWRLRKALQSVSAASYLLVNDLTISFNASSDYSLDAASLEELGESVSADQLITVLSFYQGELLPGFYDEWLASEREHLHFIFEHHMARLMTLLQDEGRWPDILDWAERWIKLGQKPEPAFRALMSAYAAQGDMSKVAGTYERCVKSLQEFGLEPSEQSRTLYESLRARTAKLETASTIIVAEKRQSLPKINLPVPITSFVGREKEVEEIIRLLGKNRLITLVGSGGVGKTRLAIQSSYKLLGKYKDGVWWIDLVGMSDPALVPQAIARAVDVHEVPNQPLIETLVAEFQSRQALLVLDNCEHLILACAQLADRLLSGTKHLKILATSREALDILGEVAWSVPSLSLPGMQDSVTTKALAKYESVRLFLERAAAMQPKFSLTEQNAGAVVQICRRLSGLPLAIELAAARVKMMTVDEIAVRLDDRFSLLTSGKRTALPRQQTLRATIDWSHDLLTEPERILFRRLAVFAGGFTLDSAEAVCEQGDLKRREILDLLGRLVDKSLVVVEQESLAGETRYRLLETIRQYAFEKLMVLDDEARTVRDRHLEFFVRFASEAEPQIFGFHARTWFGRVERELDNLRAAMIWSTSTGKAAAALQIAGSLVYFWFVHGPLIAEWHDRIQQALSRPEGMERTHARAKALNAIGFMYWADMYPTDKRTELEEALSISRELDDQQNIATALRNLGLLANIQGNYGEGRSFLEESLGIWRKIGSQRRTDSAWTLTFLGDVVLNLNEADQAQLFYEEAVTIWREHGDRNFLAYSLRRLSQLAWRQAKYEKAKALCIESLNLNIEVGDRRGGIACLAGFVAIAVAQQKLERAARLATAVEGQLNSIGIRLLQLDKAEFDHNLTYLQTQLDEKTLNQYRKRGRTISFDEAIAFALEEA